MTTCPHPSLSPCRCGLPLEPYESRTEPTVPTVPFVGCRHCDTVCRIGSSCERCAASRTTEARS